jgi:hypothetical protein
MNGLGYIGAYFDATYASVLKIDLQNPLQLKIIEDRST